jgi:hypothetical protein
MAILKNGVRFICTNHKSECLWGSAVTSIALASMSISPMIAAVTQLVLMMAIIACGVIALSAQIDFAKWIAFFFGSLLTALGWQITDWIGAVVRGIVRP